MRIGTLRTQAAAREAPAVRSNLTRLLASADLAAPGLPPQAVLIVRRLADPLPGRLAGRLHDVQLRAEWERRVRERLAAVQRRAARPALGHVPADAEAVLFADESELLACLARDIAKGQARRWWWETLLAGGSALRLTGSDYTVILVKRLVEQARSAPAVMARLAEWGEAAPVLRALTPQQASAVLGAMLKAYGLPDLSGAPETVRPQAAPWLIPARMGRSAVAGLGREREALLGVALDLVARPQIVARRAYQSSLRAWWQSAGRTAPAAPAAPPDPELTDAARPHQGERRETPTRPARSDERGAPGPQIEAAGVGQAQETVQTPGAAPRDRNAEAARLDRNQMTGGPAASSDAQVRLDGSSASADADHATAARPPSAEAFGALAGETVAPTDETVRRSAPASAETAELTAPVEPGPTDSRAFAQATVETPPTPALPELLGEGVATEWGGVLYLINLMAALDLPDAFEAGWRLASGVGPWGLLEALGRELLGEESRDDDPLWPALAHLDGRAPGEPPGVRLPKSRPRRWPAFEAPAGWVAGDLPAKPPANQERGPMPPANQERGPMPPANQERGPMPPATASRRLIHEVCWKQTGRVLRASRPRSASGNSLRIRFAGGVGGAHLAGGVGGAHFDSAPYSVRYPPLLARWLMLALPLIEGRLRLALGETPIGEVLRLPGRLYVSRTHVDLVTSLEHILLAARLAGLDRNPGWRPEFGRVVYFHFE